MHLSLVVVEENELLAVIIRYNFVEIDILRFARFCAIDICHDKT